MKGWYCIYECVKNEWLYDGIMWVKDRDYHARSIGTKHAIMINQSYNYNPNLPQVEVIDTEHDVVLTEGPQRVDRDQLMKFETISEAEDFLLKTFSSSNGQFYSIRKIYF
jgi:hypothetical protein